MVFNTCSKSAPKQTIGTLGPIVLILRFNNIERIIVMMSLHRNDDEVSLTAGK